MSILLDRTVPISEIPVDKTFLIYGAPGTGKTTLAASFPKSPKRKMLYVDIMENGTASVAVSDRRDIDVIRIEKFEELDEIVKDLVRGYVIDDKTMKQIPLNYHTVVFDTLTQLEYLLQEFLISSKEKSQMTLELWGIAKRSQVGLFQLMKRISTGLGAYVVMISHEKELAVEGDNEKNKIIPSLMTSVSRDITGKVSYVWYTKIEKETTVNSDGKAIDNFNFNTYIDAHDYYESKCRKPKGMVIPRKVKDLTFNKFKLHILDKMFIDDKPTETSAPVPKSILPTEEDAIKEPELTKPVLIEVPKITEKTVGIASVVSKEGLEEF